MYRTPSDRSSPELSAHDSTMPLGPTGRTGLTGQGGAACTVRRDSSATRPPLTKTLAIQARRSHWNQSTDPAPHFRVQSGNV